MKRRDFLKWSLLAAGGAACIYPTVVAPLMVQVNYYQLHLPRLPRAFDGFTLVHLTDLHYRPPLMPLAFIQHVIDIVATIDKDVIVCTGDYVNQKKSAEDINTVWPLLTRLVAPLGVYSVLGNHDHLADTEKSLYWLEKSGQNIRNRCHCFERGGERLWLAGGGDLWADHINFDDLLRPVPVNDCRVVLAHNPDSADSKFSQYIDLMICGHTHGGQVDVPFYGPPILPVRNYNYSHGLKMSAKAQPVFISKGIGWSIAPVRFNCPPEIAVIKLISTT